MRTEFEGETNLLFFAYVPPIPTSESGTFKYPLPFPKWKCGNGSCGWCTPDPSKIYTSCYEIYYKRKVTKRKKIWKPISERGKGGGGSCSIWEGADRGVGLPPPAPLPPPSRPLVSLLPSGAARASRAQNFPLSPSLPFSSPLPPPAPSSPSSLPLFPPPLLPPPSPSSPPPAPSSPPSLLPCPSPHMTLVSAILKWQYQMAVKVFSVNLVILKNKIMYFWLDIE